MYLQDKESIAKAKHEIEIMNELSESENITKLLAY
jgi:hypothetical protein